LLILTLTHPEAIAFLPRVPEHAFQGETIVKITVDGGAVTIDDGEPIPYAHISEVNELIGGMHFATRPELLGAPDCKACPGDAMRSFATNCIAYRRPGTSVAVLVNLCPVHLVPERAFADWFGWTLHVLGAPLPLAAQYLFAVDVPSDRAALGTFLGAHRDVLGALLGDDPVPAVPAAAAVNTGDAGKEAEAALSSAPEDGGKVPASGDSPGVPLPQRRAGAARRSTR
jgi:hypothetical protein